MVQRSQTHRVLAVMAFLVAACAPLCRRRPESRGHHLAGRLYRRPSTDCRLQNRRSPSMARASEGNSGCNGFTSASDQVSISNGRLDLGGMLMTLGGCVDPMAGTCR